MQPAAAALEGQDAGRRRAQQVAVVADQEDRLARRRDPALELELGGDVEEVVGLVEQQHLGVAGEQHLEHEPLALAARERARRAGADVVQPGAHDPAAGGVPLPLELVAAELRPVADRLPEPHPGAGRVRAGGQLALGGSHPLARLAQPRRRQLEQQLAHACARRRRPRRRPAACRRTGRRPTSPSSASSRPARTRSSVDLPTPLAPTTPTCWPAVTRNETSENSRSPPGCAYARFETTTWDTARDSLARVPWPSWATVRSMPG